MSLLLRRRVLSESSLLLTKYPAYSAFSLRKLNNSYVGPCIRVRRSSDNAEQDVNFLNGVIDTASLTSFVGANDGFVVTWYDQMSNHNLGQANIANQPKIVIAGIIITSNGLPACEFDGTNDFMGTGTPQSPVLDDSSMVALVFEGTNSEDIQGVFEETISGASRAAILCDTRNANFRHTVYDPDGVGTVERLSFASEQPAGQRLFVTKNVGSSIEAFAEGVSIDTETLTQSFGGNTTFIIGRQTSGGFYLDGFIQEAIVWNDDQSSNRILIENNINNFYSIY